MTEEISMLKQRTEGIEKTTQALQTCQGEDDSDSEAAILPISRKRKRTSAYILCAARRRLMDSEKLIKKELKVLT